MKKQFALILSIVMICMSVCLTAYAKGDYETPRITVSNKVTKTTTTTTTTTKPNNTTTSTTKLENVDQKWDTSDVPFSTTTTTKPTTTTKTTTTTKRPTTTTTTKPTTTTRSTTTTTTTKPTTVAKTSISKCSVSNIKAKTYTGKALTQAPTVKLGSKTLKLGTDYKLSYANNKNVGTATVTITGIGKYKGTQKVTFKINPKATTMSKLTTKSKQLTATWKKQATQTTGYQIQYSTDKKFKSGVKTVTVSSNKTTSKTIKKLKSKKTYYVRVRTYNTIKSAKSTKYYSSWSAAKYIKVK